MNSRVSLLVVSLFACLSACADQVATAERDSIEIEFVQKGEGSLLLSVDLLNEVTVENIRVRRDKHLDDWVLEFRSVAGLRISSKDGVSVGRVVQLTEHNYLQLIEAVLRSLKNEYPQVAVSRIQCDASLVDNTWQSVLSIVRVTSKDLDGNVEQKNMRITDVIIEAVSDSAQVNATCNALRLYGSPCTNTSVTMNPVAFRAEAIGMPWPSLNELPDAGLRDDTWFTIRTQ